MARDGKDKETYYKCVKSTETSTHIQSCAETHRPHSVLKVQASCTVRDPAEVNGKSIQGPDEFYDCHGQGVYSLRLPFGLPLKNEQVGCPHCGWRLQLRNDGIWRCLLTQNPAWGCMTVNTEGHLQWTLTTVLSTSKPHRPELGLRELWSMAWTQVIQVFQFRWAMSLLPGQPVPPQARTAAWCVAPAQPWPSPPTEGWNVLSNLPFLGGGCILWFLWKVHVLLRDRYFTYT